MIFFQKLRKKKSKNFFDQVLEKNIIFESFVIVAKGVIKAGKISCNKLLTKHLLKKENEKISDLQKKIMETHWKPQPEVLFNFIRLKFFWLCFFLKLLKFQRKKFFGSSVHFHDQNFRVSFLVSNEFQFYDYDFSAKTFYQNFLFQILERFYNKKMKKIFKKNSLIFFFHNYDPKYFFMSFHQRSTFQFKTLQIRNFLRLLRCLTKTLDL